MADAHPHRAQLALPDPHAREASQAATRSDLVSGCEAHHGVLQPFDVVARAAAQAPQVQHRVADQLSRPVKGDVTAAQSVVYLRAQRLKLLRAQPSVCSWARGAHTRHSGAPAV